MNADDLLHTGWREFSRLPESVSWVSMRRELLNWPAAQLNDTVCNLLSEATLDFSVAGIPIRLDVADGMYRLFTSRSDAPDDILQQVEAYCRSVALNRGS